MISELAPDSRTGRTVAAFKRALTDHLYYTRGQGVHTVSLNDVYMTLAYTVRDFLMEHWQKNVEAYFEQNPKFVYYLSAEFLMGPQLTQNMLYTDTTELAAQTLA